MRKEELFRKMKCKGKKIFAMSIAAAVFMSALTTGYSCDKVNVSAAKKKISTVKIGKAVVTTANGKVAVQRKIKQSHLTKAAHIHSREILALTELL